MKNIFLIFILFFASSCLNNSFLELYPKDQQTVDTSFQTYENFKTYSWGLYDIFPGYGSNSIGQGSIFQGDYYADNVIFSNTDATVSRPYADQGKIAPTSSASWNYKYIRRVNLMLDNIDKSKMSGPEKEHWRSVGYFFRSMAYSQLLAMYGGVPWIDHVLTDSDPMLFMKRDSRDLVAGNILKDLQTAEANIKVSGDGRNTINQAVVRALISRFTLFEGTFRKYHGLAGGASYLNECIRVSKLLIDANPTLHPKFSELFNSEDLKNIGEVMLYRSYIATVGLGHSLTRGVRTGENMIEATKDAVDSYLCKDGKPVSTSPLYQGDKTIYAQFRNRDNRLYFNVCPPFKVNPTGALSSSFSFTYTSVPQEREFIDLMSTIASASNQSLPNFNFRKYVSVIQPAFYDYPNKTNWGRTRMGYWVWKYYNTPPVESSNNDTSSSSDAPIFRVGEVMVNYAEAMAETGQFVQATADISINKLRIRAGVAPMVVSEISNNFDPIRLLENADVSPILWEIRRERRSELFGEGFRFNDIRRWKKGTLLNKQPLGVYTTNAATYKVNVTGGPNSNEGYVYFFAIPKGWLDKYYYEPIPLEEIALNPNLEQNPGW
jgi:hypothetical protein